MTAILQISDTHIVPVGTMVSGRLETADVLLRLIGRINMIRDQIGSLDAVLVSGDLSDDGSDQSYVRFKTLMEPLRLPVHVITGNHDARAPMRRAFADQFPADGPLDFVQQIGDIHLIGLDTLVEGQGAGRLAPESLTFLANALAEARTSPVLLALHHPPFQSGIKFMDKIGLSNRAALGDVVRGHEGPLRIVCGHIHSLMVSDFAGHVAISAPSPCSTFAYDQRADAPVGFMALDGGCLLHRWDNGFQTIHIGPAAGPGPFPFQ
jgi:3',5'-cyclic AMP phosphodiesterase CpdA